jgi:hypothetical protein
LQTERDKARVLEGLEGASAAAGGGFNRQNMDNTLSRLGNRVFVLHDVHEREPVVFQTRWVMSYLRGPLTRDQIETLMQARKTGAAAPGDSPAAGKPAARTGIALTEVDRPVLPPDIAEYFWAYRGTTPAGHHLLYQPSLMGRARLHFVNAKSGVDVWETLWLVSAADEVAVDDPWANSEILEEENPDLDSKPAESARFAPLPPAFAKSKSYVGWATALKNYLYRTHTLTLFRCPALKATSKAGESERNFRLRLAQHSREGRDDDVEKLREKYAKRLGSLEDKIRRARHRLEREQAQANQSTFQVAVSVGSSILGALVGRKKLSRTNVGRATTSARAAGRAMQQRGDVALASEDLAKYQQEYSDLEGKLQSEIEEMQLATAPDGLAIERVELRPKKSEISVERVALVWTPWWSGAGPLTKAF